MMLAPISYLVVVLTMPMYATIDISDYAFSLLESNLNEIIESIPEILNHEYYGTGYHEMLNISSSTVNADLEQESDDGLKPKDWTWKKIQAGVEAGNAITTAIASGTYSGSFIQIGQIAKNFAPFLGAIGSALGFLNMFIPTGMSPELQLMLIEFARINAKFDQVFAKINDLEAVVVEKAIKCRYGKYQSEISSLFHLLNNFLNVSTNESNNNIRESRKRIFLEAYESSDKTATLKLWQGMTSQRVLADYIPEIVAKYTSNHRLRTQNILKSVLNSILQGVDIMMYYYKMKGDNDSFVDQKAQWVEKIQQLTDELLVFDRNVANRYLDQAREDTDRVLAMMFGSSNKDVADVLYQRLSEKYDWRNWLVVVYNELHGGNNHWVQYCGGFYRFRKHGRNTVVASIGKYYSTMDEESVQEILKSIPYGEEGKNRHSSYECYDAHTIFDYVSLAKNCEYPGVGVVIMSGDIAYRAPDDHLVVVDKICHYDYRYSFKIHAFR